MSRTLIGYLRVAPRERAEARPGLTLQRAALDRAARERGWELVRVDEDVRSGRTLRRPGLRAALASCRSGEAEGIAVARLDRLTYSLTDLAEIVREAVDGDFTIVSLDPDVDLASDGGRAVGEVLAEAATWQPRAITTAGRALAGRPGRPSSTPRPAGPPVLDAPGGRRPHPRPARAGHDPPGDLRHAQRRRRPHPARRRRVAPHLAPLRPALAELPTLFVNT